MSETRDSRLVGSILFLVALFGPAGVTFAGFEEISFTVGAISWIYSGGYWSSFTFYPPYMWVQMLPLTGFRFWFVYEMVRLYQLKTTRRRMKLAAVASEAPFVFAGIVSLIPTFLYSAYLYIYIVSPSLVLPLVGWILLRIKHPPQEAEIWEGLPDSVPWWGEVEAAEDI
ncbi:MAG: hypothetical protein ACW99U_02985 [Candidatus Thorarchaeota archaeon]